MITLFIIGWFVVGFLLFLLSCKIVAGFITVGDLIIGIIGGLLGPFSIIALLIALAAKYGDKKII
jgi:hypothetical protein